MWINVPQRQRLVSAGAELGSHSGLSDSKPIQPRKKGNTAVGDSDRRLGPSGLHIGFWKLSCFDKQYSTWILEGEYK